ncbi:hypothetical protein BWQ96_03586 [Gracilariopsis chorda]|uniref:Uncharacterized protein n=1 Tax=Gracilariopsis chorda TaxID=448386 RepID=A0A2V3IY39_9FLOR|nr:hypothetical protein BWQ96_03586 [Gracilariopsis chorda]|eukprot:PXF46597.1 hypothetical protein BWQ96_03586 [Gracilariopsis chorda]
MYDQFRKTVTARPVQLTKSGSKATEAMCPVNLKYCIDHEYVESAIALDLIPHVNSYNHLTDSNLKKYLDGNAEASQDSLTLESLDAIFDRELRMDMSDKSARSRMEALFIA